MKEWFDNLIKDIKAKGYGGDIEWQRNLKPCSNPGDFAGQTVWVILNSGMREQIARQISDKIWKAIKEGKNISTVFGHKGKVRAIEYVLENKERLFEEYEKAYHKIAYLQTIPFIGGITCYHLAKNLGHDVVKPDRHLVRIASQHNTTPDELCERISKETGERKCVVDIVIWRACNLGII